MSATTVWLLVTLSAVLNEANAGEKSLSQVNELRVCIQHSDPNADPRDVYLYDDDHGKDTIITWYTNTSIKRFYFDRYKEKYNGQLFLEKKDGGYNIVFSPVRRRDLGTFTYEFYNVLNGSRESDSFTITEQDLSIPVSTKYELVIVLVISALIVAIVVIIWIWMVIKRKQFPYCEDGSSTQGNGPGNPPRPREDGSNIHHVRHPSAHCNVQQDEVMLGGQNGAGNGPASEDCPPVSVKKLRENFEVVLPNTQGTVRLTSRQPATVDIGPGGSIIRDDAGSAEDIPHQAEADDAEGSSTAVGVSYHGKNSQEGRHLLETGGCSPQSGAGDEDGSTFAGGGPQEDSHLSGTGDSPPQAEASDEKGTTWDRDGSFDGKNSQEDSHLLETLSDPMNITSTQSDNPDLDDSTVRLLKL